MGRLPHQLTGLPNQLCALPHQLLPDLVVLWLQNEHFPPQARKAIGFEDFLALKCLLVCQLFQGQPSVGMTFCPTNFFRKAPPMIGTERRQIV